MPESCTNRIRIGRMQGLTWFRGNPGKRITRLGFLAPGRAQFELSIFWTHPLAIRMMRFSGSKRLFRAEVTQLLSAFSALPG